MRRVVVDAFHFVGLSGGSGGSGNYILSLIEELSRLVDVRVLASRHSAHHFRAVSERARRLTVSVEGDDHAEAIRIAVEDADILYAPFTALPQRSTYSRVPTVTAIHDLQHRVLKSFFPEPERIERDNAFFDAVTEADAVLTFSQVERKNIADAYGIQHRIGVVPHAPFLAEEVMRSFGDAPIDPKRNPYIKKFGRYILYPAVNWPHKNHYRLLEAMRFLADEFSVTDVKLILTGASCVESREHFYQQLLEEPWASQRVVTMGFVSNVQLFMLMRGAEALVFPSLYEGFGIPVLEAMRLGTPVIASDLPVTREWFADCYEPFRNNRDSWMMAGDLARFLGSPQRRREVQQRALARSMDFSSRRTAEETLQFLSEVADEFQPTRRRGLRSYRDIVALRRKTHRLLFHILIDTADADETHRAIATVKKLIADPADEVGIVWVCPYSTGADSPAGSRPGQIEGRKRRRVPLKNPGGDGVGWINAVLPTLADLGDVVYFDQADPIAGRSRAIRFYTAAQVEASFHCLIRASALASVREEASDAFLAHINAAQLDSADADGFYVGSLPLVNLRDQTLKALHSNPERIDEALADPAIAVHNFVLTNAFMLRGSGPISAPDWFGKAVLAQLIVRARITEPRARFAYIETELTSRVGHPFALLQGLCDAASASGLNPIAGVNRDASGIGLADGMVIDPCFSSYWQASEPHVTPTYFAEELLLFLDRHRLGPRDFVYLHMPYPTLIAGALQVIVTRRLEELPVFLIRICSIDESFRWHNIRETSLLGAIEQLGTARRDRIRLFVESIPLQRYFETQTGLRLPVLLNPVNRILVTSAIKAADLRQQRRRNGRVVIGYFGEARREKGFQLVPDIVERVLNSYGGDRVQFRIQVAATVHNDNEEVRTARDRLTQLVQLYAADKAVELYDELPDMDSYYNALAGCDGVLMPYEEPAYKVRGSGVALESLALGIPIVVTVGTDMAETFAGPGCIAAKHDAESFARACGLVVENPAALSAGAQEFARSSPLVCSESEYMQTLISDVPSTADAPAEPPIAIWIGNDVLSQGCSAVYDAQRDFLRRHGFEIYNVYVPFPDLNGSLPTDETLEKNLIENSLGWRTNGYDFGCYSWILNQFDDEPRFTVLEHIAEHGGSTEQFLKMNSYNQCPPSLLRLVEARRIALVCLNYVHLLPVVEKLGLLGRKGTRVVLETHDIQAYQHAIRAQRDVDEPDKELELSQLNQVDAVVAISRREYDEICEMNPWVAVEFILPAMRIGSAALLDWRPGASGLRSPWLDLWLERADLQGTFDLRTPDALDRYAWWIILHGRLEHPEIEIGPELHAFANEPHADFATGDDGLAVSNLLGAIWSARDDLKIAFPNATDPDHADRPGLLEWCKTSGAAECRLLPDGKLLLSGSDRRGWPSVTPALIEALILARPSRIENHGYRVRVLESLRQVESIDVLIVASDHPANVTSVRQFIHEVYAPYLAPHNISLLIAGRCGSALEPDDILPGMIAVGEVDALDPFYRIAHVVAVPTSVGTGTPIKVLDAFARGLCVSVSDFVDQALDLRAYGFPMAADGQGFAADIRSLLASPDARQERRELARRFSAEHLDPRVYDAKWRTVAAIPSRQSSAALPPITGQEQMSDDEAVSAGALD